MSILEVKGVRKVYVPRFGGSQVEALKNVTFSVEEGEYVSIMGESGSGKTTLLNILAALDRPTGGVVLLDGQDLTKIREDRVAAFRRDCLGFVFQEFNLLDTFTIEDNILLPLVLANKPYSQMQKRLAPAGRTARDHGPAQKIPLRDLRRAEAARGGGAGADRGAAPGPCGRADRRARLPRHGRAPAPL